MMSIALRLPEALEAGLSSRSETLGTSHYEAHTVIDHGVTSRPCPFLMHVWSFLMHGFGPCTSYCRQLESERKTHVTGCRFTALGRGSVPVVVTSVSVHRRLTGAPWRGPTPPLGRERSTTAKRCGGRGTPGTPPVALIGWFSCLPAPSKG